MTSLVNIEPSFPETVSNGSLELGRSSACWLGWRSATTTKCGCCRFYSSSSLRETGSFTG